MAKANKVETKNTTKNTVLKEFTTDILYKEIASRNTKASMRRNKILKEEKSVIKNIQKEIRVLADGLIYPITIAGIVFEFRLEWDGESESPYICYNRKYKILKKHDPETKFIAKAMDSYMDCGSFLVTDIPAVDKAAEEVSARIKMLWDECERLAIKYGVENGDKMLQVIYENTWYKS